MPSVVDIIIRSVNESEGGFGRAREGFDAVDTAAMGFRDTITGVQDTMTGFQGLMGEGSMASATLGDKLFVLGAGIGDLASGMVSFIVPMISAVAAMNAESAASVRATVSSVAHRAATIAGAAASGVMAAAQGVLNAVMSANPIALVVIAIAALAAGLIYAYQHSETFRMVIQVIGQFITGTLGPALQKVGEFLKNVFGPAFEAAGKAISGAWNWMKNLVGAGEDAADSEKKLKDETDKAKKAAEDHAKALKDESDKAREASGQQLSLRDSLRNLAQATADATKSVQENGKNLDINTEKGRKNQSALDSIAKAANDAGKAITDSGGSAVDAGKKMDEGRQAFIRAATQMGMTKSEAQKLANELIGIPKSVQIAISATDNATRVINGVYQRLQEINGTTAYVNVVSTNRNAIEGRAHGGVIGAANGGPRSGRIRVGEYGAEDIDLAPGSMVHTASDSQVGSGGGGADTRVTFGFEGAEDEFMVFIRKVFRVNGIPLGA
jgi:hypothetical protein